MIKIFEFSLHGYVTNDFNLIEYLYITIDGMPHLMDMHPVSGKFVVHQCEGQCAVWLLAEPVDMSFLRDENCIDIDCRKIIENLCILGLKKCSGANMYYIDGTVEVIKRDLLLVY